MVTGIVAFAITQSQELPKPATLRSGEIIRVYERTMSRQGTYERIFVLTPNKVFSKNGDVRHSMMLSPSQQGQLKEILTAEPIGLRTNKRPNPMWPSAYDGSDIWMSYRIGKATALWTNRDYDYPSAGCSLTKLLEEIKAKLNPSI